MWDTDKQPIFPTISTLPAQLSWLYGAMTFVLRHLPTGRARSFACLSDSSLALSTQVMATPMTAGRNSTPPPPIYNYPTSICLFSFQNPPHSHQDRGCFPEKDDEAEHFDDKFVRRWKLKKIMELTREERNRGVYIFGKTGSGKTTLLKTLILDDIAAGRGLIFIDPHGIDCIDILNAIPSPRIQDVCYIDLSDRHYMVGLDPIIEPHHLVTAFTGIWGEQVSDRMKWFLFNGLQLIKDNPRRSLLDLPRIYYDAPFRNTLLGNTANPETIQFWKSEHPSLSKRYVEDAPGTIYNKVGQFLASTPIRAALSQRTPAFDLESAIRFNQIVIVNIAKGRVGKEAASLFGSLFLSHTHSILFQGALAECNLYVDEFQSFGTDLIADMLSEDRKFGLNATLANQYFSQLSEANRDALLGNVGTIVAFRIGSKDARHIAPEFNRDVQDFNGSTLMNQPPFHAYVKRAEYDPYQIKVAPPQARTGSLQTVIEESRRRFGRKV